MNKPSEIKDLVIRLTGEVQESNLAEFKESALAVIGNIKTDLVTDNDFVTAEQAIKDCKLAEQRIAQAKQDGMHSTASISELFGTMDELAGELSKTRLSLEKQVRAEKSKRKKELTDEGIKIIRDKVNASQISHAFEVNFSAVLDAIKGKRSIEKMQAAIDDVVSVELENLEILESRYIENLAAIEAIDADYPGLFPDRKQIALSGLDTVSAFIEGRVSNFKLAEAEKKRVADEAEKKRIADEAEKKRVVNAHRQDATPEVQKTPEYFNCPQELPVKHPDPEPEQNETEPGLYTLTLHIKGSKDDARNAAQLVNVAVGSLGCIKSINLTVATQEQTK
jgi:hypothetical protein